MHTCARICMPAALFACLLAALLAPLPCTLTFSLSQWVKHLSTLSQILSTGGGRGRSAHKRHSSGGGAWGSDGVRPLTHDLSSLVAGDFNNSSFGSAAGADTAPSTPKRWSVTKRLLGVAGPDTPASPSPFSSPYKADAGATATADVTASAAADTAVLEQGGLEADSNPHLLQGFVWKQSDFRKADAGATATADVTASAAADTAVLEQGGLEADSNPHLLQGFVWKQSDFRKVHCAPRLLPPALCVVHCAPSFLL